MSDEPRFLGFGSFVFDVRNRRLMLEGQPVPLTPKAADLLLALLHGAGDVVSKESLLKTVWADTCVEEGNLAFNIHAIREALRAGGNGQFIENIPRRGYRFALPISETGSPAAVHRRVSPAADAKIAAPKMSASGTPVARTGRRILTPLRLAALIIAVLVGGGAVALNWSQPPHLRVARYHQLTADGREKDIGRLLSDASYVYFHGDRSGPDLVVPVNGGEPRSVGETLRDFVILDIHPVSGEFLVVRREDAGPLRQLWVVTPSGSPKRVGTISCEGAAWSPDADARQIACTTESALHVISADGSKAQRIVVTEGGPESPRWSPDGRSLRFTVVSVVDSEPRRAMWEVRADGTELHRLALGTSTSECCGSWTPDGQHFVFESTRNGRTDLWSLFERKDLLGRVSYTSEPLTAGPLGFSHPGLSVDGTRIFALGLPLQGELVRYDRSLRAFVRFLDGVSALWIDFSRDGRSVAYARYPEDALWRANADGSEARQLTFGPMKVDGCSWSPDGRWIAFRGKPPGGPFRIFIMPAEGGEAKPIITEEREQGVPTWSPDGTRLVFGGVPTDHGNAKGETIQLYDVGNRQFSTVPGSTNLWTPRWSPDGRYISAQTITEQSLRLFDVATGSWKAIGAADHIDNPTWSRDSQFISYHTEGGIRSLRRVWIADGRVEETVNLEGFPTIYWWSGLSPDGSPLVLRQIGGPEIYALELDRR